MKAIKTHLLAIGLLLLPVLASATNVSLKKGEQRDVPCSATAPAGGWITHAFYSLVDPDDAKYLGLAYTSSDCKVTYYGLAAKSNIKVEVTYSYSYKGTYDNNIHVGHASYYEYVTVTGAPEATSFKIREGGSLKMKKGQQMTLHCDFTPKGSQSDVEWGLITSLSTYNCIDVVVNDGGASCDITAKKNGTAYLAAMFPGNQSSVQTVIIKISDDAETVPPTAVTLSPEELELMTGDTYTVTSKLTPENASTKLTWNSSDEQVATVSSSGKITANSAGEAIISATAEDGVTQGTVKVTVKEAAAGFSVPGEVVINLGYSYKVNPVFSPVGATDNLTWKTGNSSVASVSANGEIKGKYAGTTTVTVTSKKLNVSREIKVTVKEPAKGMDSGNVRVKVQNFKGIVNRAVVIGK